jgi:hypothetical protein
METKRTDLNPSTVVKTDANRDPLSGAPGSHPVGVGAGAAGGAASGAVVGAVVAGPIGAAVGGVAGAVAGGFAGKAAAEEINPTNEHAYWRNEFGSRPYVTEGALYAEYRPAYQYGWESYNSYSTKAKSFDEVEPELRSTWESRRGKSKLDWEQAQAATRDAWQRVEKQRVEKASCGHGSC